MDNRLSSFIGLKKAAYKLASNRGFFKNDIQKYDLTLNLKERDVTESIILDTWDYHKRYGTNMTDGEETRQIMHNCMYAGMYASKYVNLSADEILSKITAIGVENIADFVERTLNFDTKESFVTAVVAKGLAQDIFNNNMHLYPNYSNTMEVRWEYYKDMACVLFEIGAMYYNNRD